MEAVTSVSITLYSRVIVWGGVQPKLASRQSHGLQFQERKKKKPRKIAELVGNDHYSPNCSFISRNLMNFSKLSRLVTVIVSPAKFTTLALISLSTISRVFTTSKPHILLRSA